MVELIKTLEEKLGKQIDSDVLQKAIDELPHYCKATLEMRYYKQASFNDICSALNRSISSVRHYHSYGIFLLRMQLKNEKS